MTAEPFEAPRRVAHLMAAYPHPWAICGGWAIDLFLGRVTRSHKDVDVAVLRCDQLAARSYLTSRGWSLAIAHDGVLTPWDEGTLLELPIHGVWCKNPDHDPDFVEILLNEGDDQLFRFRRDQSLTRGMERAVITSPVGLPVLAPEIALLYKAAHVEVEENAADFETALPHLSAERREWLREGIARLFPDHPWLSRL